MPRYLATDYLSLVQHEQRGLLQRLLLIEPAHLEKVEWYAHSGKLLTHDYRNKPCTRAEKLELDLGDPREIEQLSSIAPDPSALTELEKFCGSQKQHSEPTFELIPSSNPDSDSSIDPDILTALTNSTEPTKEVDGDGFLPFHLHSREEKVSQWILEEPVSGCCDQLLQWCPPTVAMLSRRLKPKALTDPFVDQDGHSLREKSFCQEDLVWNDKAERETPERHDITGEIFTKQNIDFLKDIYIEEEIPVTPVEPKATSSIDNELKLPNAKALKSLLNLTYDKNEDTSDITDLAHIDVRDPGPSGIELFTGSEGTVQDTPDHIAFMALNAQGIEATKEHRTVKLESPIETPDIADTGIHSAKYQLFASLEALPISPSQEIKLMSPQQVGNLTADLFHSDKYLEQLLKLKVPDVACEKDKLPLPVDACRALSLKPEKCQSGLDLHLPWDPTAYSTPNMTKCGPPEKLGIPVLQGKDSHALDSFTKFDITIVKDVGKTDSQKAGEDSNMGSHSEATELTGASKIHWNALGHERDESQCNISKQKFCETVSYVPDSEAIVSDSRDQTPVLAKNVIHAEDAVALNMDSSHGQSPMHNTHAVLHNTNKNKTSQFKLEQNVHKACPKIVDVDEETLGANAARQNQSAHSVKRGACIEELVDSFIRSRKGHMEQEQERSMNGNDAVDHYGTPKNSPVSKTDISKPATPMTPQTPSGRERRHSKQKIMKVEVQDDFIDVLSSFLKAARPYLKILRESGVIPCTHSLSSLTPDTTRFILHQHERVIKDIKQIGTSSVEYQAVACLHLIVCCLDNVLHCTLSSALRCLQERMKKNETLNNGVLDELAADIKSHHLSLCKAEKLQPKTDAMLHYAQEWLSKKRLKSPDHDLKILVILKREDPLLQQSLLGAFGKIGGIKCVAYTKERPASYSEIANSLDHHNCLLVQGAQIEGDFPWMQFSLVVDYESTEQSQWKELCRRQNIRFLGLTLADWSELEQKLNKNIDNVQEVSVDEVPEPVEPELTVLVSETVFDNGKLVQLLEGKYGLRLLCRPYEHYQVKSFADVLVDERTGTVLIGGDTLQEESRTMQLVTRLTGLSLQLECCWVILFAQQGETYSYSGSSIRNRAALHGSVLQITNNNPSFKVKIIETRDVGEACSVVVQQTKMAKLTSRVWEEDGWWNRGWLTPDMSKHERFLLGFPCLNSFSAQLLLTQGPMKDLFCLSMDQLECSFPWLPRFTIQFFHEMCWRECGLRLDENIPEGRTADAFATPEGTTLLAVQWANTEPSPWSSPTKNSGDGYCFTDTSDLGWKRTGELRGSHCPTSKPQMVNKYPARMGNKEECGDTTGVRISSFMFEDQHLGGNICNENSSDGKRGNMEKELWWDSAENVDDSRECTEPSYQCDRDLVIFQEHNMHSTGSRHRPSQHINDHVMDPSLPDHHPDKPDNDRTVPDVDFSMSQKQSQQKPNEFQMAILQNQQMEKLYKYADSPIVAGNTDCSEEYNNEKYSELTVCTSDQSKTRMQGSSTESECGFNLVCNNSIGRTSNALQSRQNNRDRKNVLQDDIGNPRTYDYDAVLSNNPRYDYKTNKPPHDYETNIRHDYTQRTDQRTHDVSPASENRSYHAYPKRHKVSLWTNFGDLVASKPNLSQLDANNFSKREARRSQLARSHIGRENRNYTPMACDPPQHSQTTTSHQISGQYEGRSWSTRSNRPLHSSSMPVRGRHQQIHVGLATPLRRTHNLEESPPMDLDSDSEINAQMWSNQRFKEFSVDESSTSMYEADPAMGFPSSNPVRMTTRTPKRPRLSYERIPGAKGGQTKLTFG